MTDFEKDNLGISQNIVDLIKVKNWRGLKEFLHSFDVHHLIGCSRHIPEEGVFILLRLLDKEKAALFFSELSKDEQLTLLEQMRKKDVRKIISELSPDDRTALFEEIPGEITHQLLNTLPIEIRKESLELLGYPKGSAGRLMTPDYVAVFMDWTIQQTIEHIRKYGHSAETISNIYIVDSKWRLLDDVDIRKIIIADPDQKIASISDGRFAAISAFDDQENTVKVFEKYNYSALPVVDSDNILLGIVTVDDILDIVEKETTEDFQKGASITPFDTVYSKMPPLSLYTKRVPWLFFLAVGGFSMATIMSRFEEILAAVIALAFFVPKVIQSGGNAGSQAATIMIRAIATGDITPALWLKIIKKELFVGTLLGLTLGVLMIIWTWIMGFDMRVGMSVSVSMLAIVTGANMLGGVLPIILSKLKLDPAIISGPFITTVVDIIGIIIYLSIATLFVL